MMALWEYALRTNDARPLVALGQGRKSCSGCARFAQELARRHRQGWSVDFPGLKVRSVTVRKQGKAQADAKARVDIPQSDSYSSDGSYRNTSRPHAGATFEVRMRYTRKGYRLLLFAVS